MEMPKINYDDFYKFTISASTFLFIISIAAVSWFVLRFPQEVSKLFSLYNFIGAFYLLLGCLCVYWILWAAKKWKKNQSIIDERLETELKIHKMKLAEPVQTAPENKGSIKNVALVEYKVASVLPGTVVYDLIDSGKVWFWIKNNEEKKYKAYVGIEFFAGDYYKKLEGDYYGGERDWNLNAFTGIHAPGMPIPKKIIELARKGKDIEIKITCAIKDENDKLVEKKLPVRYIYNKSRKSWNFEP